MVGNASGTKLKVGSGATQKTVAHLSSIGGPKQSRESIDVTALDNTSGYRDFIGGYKDGGEVSLEGFFDYEDDGQQALYTAYDNEGTEDFVIEFPARIGAKWTFSGVVTSIENTGSVGDAVKFSATIKVSGKPILSALADTE